MTGCRVGHPAPEEFEKGYDYMLKAVQLRERRSIESFNDGTATTHADVMAVLADARRLAAEDHGR